MGATTRRTKAPGPARLGLAVATALAMAFSLSGLALANELPKKEPRATPPLFVSGPALVPRSSRTPPPTRPELARPRVPGGGHKRSRPASKPLYRLPVARHLIHRSELDSPHHDYPAWDLPLPVGTRVVAVRAGSVKEITSSGRCGNGVVVISPDDYTYTYCHGSAIRVRAGSRVAAGQLLMLSGDSGHSKGPHLHLQIESPAGVLLCPQSLVTSWFNGGQKGPATAISTGCFYLTARHPKHLHNHHPTSPGRGVSQEGSTSGVTRPAGSGPKKPAPQPSISPAPRPTATATPTPLPTPSPSLT